MALMTPALEDIPEIVNCYCTLKPHLGLSYKRMVMDKELDATWGVQARDGTFCGFISEEGEKLNYTTIIRERKESA